MEICGIGIVGNSGSKWMFATVSTTFIGVSTATFATSPAILIAVVAIPSEAPTAAPATSPTRNGTGHAFFSKIKPKFFHLSY